MTKADRSSKEKEKEKPPQPLMYGPISHRKAVTIPLSHAHTITIDQNQLSYLNATLLQRH